MAGFSAAKDNFILRQYFLHAFLVIFGLVLLWLNTMVPYMPWDDYLYHHKFDQTRSLYDLNLIQSFSDYLVSIKEHYLSYNNRIFPHALLQAVLQIGKGFFNVVNVLLFLLIPFFIIKAAAPEINLKSNTKGFFIFSTVCLFIWCFHFDLGMSYFWTTGSLNYTWMLPFQLYLLYGFYKIYLGRDINKTIFFVAAFVSCTTNENAVLSLFLLGLAILIYNYIKVKNLNIQLLSVTLILLLGGLVMFLSPALSAKQADHAVPFDSSFDHLKEYVIRQAYFFFKYFPVLIFFPFRSWKKISLNSFQFGLLGIALFSNLIMYLAPLTEPRTAVFGFIVMVVFMLSILSNLDLLNAKFFRYRFLGLLIFSIVLLMFRIPSFKEINSMSVENHAQLNKGVNKNVTVPGYYDSDRFSALYAEQFSKITAHNKLVANYHGQKTVSLAKGLYEVEYEALKSIGPIDYSTQLINKNLETNVVLKSLHRKQLSNDLNAMLFEVEGIQPGYRIMFRAARKGELKHKIVSILPLKIQKYLLDYMVFDEEPIRLNNRILYFNYSKPLSEYQYFLIGLYDPAKHAQVGEILKYDIQ